MKKLLVVAIVAIFSMTASAQNSAAAAEPSSVQLTKKELTPEQQEALQKVKVAAKDARERKKALKAAKASGDQAAVETAKADVKAEKKKLKAEVKAAQATGVKAPMKKIAKQRKAKQE